MTLTPGARLGPYEVIAPLGAGGMGEVYKAHDTRLGRDVAVKVLRAEFASDPDRRRRFEAESRAVAALNHPHICVLHDIGSANSPHATDGPAVEYLVMELLAGPSLAERLANGPLPMAEALLAGADIAEALAAAHKQGIVHRDLKPSNIKLTKTGAKLLDFGLAKLRPPVGAVGPRQPEPSADAAPATAPLSMLGTLPYMAPEQLEGKPVDARTDVFAFGAVLYEMLTGGRAFSGESDASVISAIMTSDPPPVSTVLPVAPPALDRLVHRCLAKRPDDRWQDAADLANELRWL
ncbi:MAG TPA: serine/threonine-protein kinase, partial [Vicinamibacterales bacterium]|nr:serine/threonine-protein kinase [Vicinamibacterales bacterium]